MLRCDQLNHMADIFPGATVLEAYPVDPDSPSYRFMGFVPSFAEAGFVETGRAGERRHVMQLTWKKSRTRPVKA